MDRTTDLDNRYHDSIYRRKIVMNTTLYHDIAQRTDSNIYIGVVGPVRTGKSTFIKRFMETLVIPNIENIY